MSTYQGREGGRRLKEQPAMSSRKLEIVVSVYSRIAILGVIKILEGEICAFQV